jgi:hypothetical protein
MKGFSGTVRIQRLTKAGLRSQEMHGKRLDESSQNRKISDEPPVTTTGLDLEELLATHEAGAKRQGGTRYGAIHMIVQFPQKLVDGDDAQLMLDHARAYAVKVFGREAIFADRVDRDEGNRHVVDLFIAPKYAKKTKAGETTWISLSRDLKELCKNRGELSKNGETNLRAQGRALQSEFHDYLVKDMGLEEAERGSAKLYSKADWKTPEEMKAQHLAKELAQQVTEDIKAIIKEAPDLFKELAAFPGEYGARDDKFDRCVALSKLVDPNSMFKIGGAVIEAEKSKVEAEALKVEAKRDQTAAAQALADAAQERTNAQTARQKTEAEGRKAGEEAGRTEGRKAIEEELAAKRKEADEDRQKAADERKAAEEDRRKAAEEVEKAAREAVEATKEREAAKTDRDAAEAAKSGAEALKSSWETKNANAVDEIARQKAELAADREALDTERRTLEADLKTQRSDLAERNRQFAENSGQLRLNQKELREGQARLRSDQAALAEREAAFSAGIEAFASGKICDAWEEDGVKTLEFLPTLPAEEEKTIRQKVQPAFDAVWAVLNRTMEKFVKLSNAWEANVLERERKTAEHLHALDEATKARISPAVVREIEDAPGASPEYIRAAQQAVAERRGRG